MPAIRIVMPNGTTRSFREGASDAVIRRAQLEMLDEMRRSRTYDGYDLDEIERIIVTQNSGTRGANASVPPPTFVPDYPAYTTDSQNIETHENVGKVLDGVSMGAKAGGLVAKLRKMPVVGSALRIVGGVTGFEPFQHWYAEQIIAERNRRAAEIYNGIGNNAVKRNGGIR